MFKRKTNGLPAFGLTPPTPAPDPVEAVKKIHQITNLQTLEVEQVRLSHIITRLHCNRNECTDDKQLTQLLGDIKLNYSLLDVVRSRIAAIRRDEFSAQSRKARFNQEFVKQARQLLTSEDFVRIKETTNLLITQ
jgi:hypothetical protein